MLHELGFGLRSLTTSAVEGASRFASGKGRHGSFGA